MIKLDYNPTTFEAETRLSQILDQPEIHSETLPLKKKKWLKYLQRRGL